MIHAITRNVSGFTIASVIVIACVAAIDQFGDKLETGTDIISRLIVLEQAAEPYETIRAEKK